MKGTDFGKMRRLLGLLLFGLTLSGIIAGCGYHYIGGEDNIDPGIQKVFVDSFANKTSQAGIEVLVRNAFIDQILRGGRFQLAGRRDEADAVIRGSVQSLYTAPLSYHTTDLAAEARLTIVMDIIFEERASKKTIWQSRNFSYNGDYPVTSGSLNATEASRKDALTKLSNDVAERAYSLMLSGF